MDRAVNRLSPGRILCGVPFLRGDVNGIIPGTVTVCHMVPLNGLYHYRSREFPGVNERHSRGEVDRFPVPLERARVTTVR